jgi:hypothetical protein
MAPLQIRSRLSCTYGARSAPYENLGVLRGFVVKLLLLFGCGSAALRALRLNLRLRKCSRCLRRLVAHLFSLLHKRPVSFWMRLHVVRANVHTQMTVLVAQA